MSGKGNYYDNAQAKSYFSIFKAELMEDGVFENPEQARSEIFHYVVGPLETKNQQPRILQVIL